MNCNDFEAKVDLYLDGVLPSVDTCRVSEHLAACTSCEALVTSYQQASALLRTAVADRAAAVDVSGLWKQIEARLEADLTAAPAAPGWLERAREWWRSRPVLFPATTPLRAGAWAAAAAAAALVITMTIPEPQQVQVVSSDAGTTRHRTVKSRSVRIDSLEVGEGHTVTTWMRPRTNTRVIWIADNDDFAVANASLSR